MASLRDHLEQDSTPNVGPLKSENTNIALFLTHPPTHHVLPVIMGHTVVGVVGHAAQQATLGPEQEGHQC
jgi:hypothetical protein